MIKIVYVPEALVSTFGPMSDPPYVKEMTMTLVDDVTWHEATAEFHNFLRGAGYLIPYSSEDDVEKGDEFVVKSLQEYYAGCSDSGDEDLLWAIDRVLLDYMSPDDHHQWRRRRTHHE